MGSKGQASSQLELCVVTHTCSEQRELCVHRVMVMSPSDRIFSSFKDKIGGGSKEIPVIPKRDGHIGHCRTRYSRKGSCGYHLALCYGEG